MPRTPGGEPRKSKLVWARVTPDEHAAVVEAAAAEGRTISAWVKRAIDAALERVVETRVSYRRRK